MRLAPQCPQCPGAMSGAEREWRCDTHGDTWPLWRSDVPEYDAFAEYLVLSRGLPTWVPWPLPLGWQVTDFGCVGHEGETPRAGFVTCVGPSDLDGVVELTVVTEEPGTGLGSRISGAVHTDPGAETLSAPAEVRLRVDGASVPLWSVSTSDGDAEFDRSVFAGEAQGRWLWLVLRPASAALLVADLPALLDISALGPELVTMPFASLPRTW